MITRGRAVKKNISIPNLEIVQKRITAHSFNGILQHRLTDSQKLSDSLGDCAFVLIPPSFFFFSSFIIDLGVLHSVKEDVNLGEKQWRCKRFLSDYKANEFFPVETQMTSVQYKRLEAPEVIVLLLSRALTSFFLLYFFESTLPSCGFSLMS